MTILVPTNGPDDWKQFLAEPEKQWKTGYSARSLAYCWEESGGLPKEIRHALESGFGYRNVKPIFAIPEHKVPLPGGSRASQNDVWVLAESDQGLISIAVEGKVSEPFGPTVEEWYTDKSAGKEKRLRYLCEMLELDFPPPNKARYQLLHRSVSALLEANRFRTTEAVMLVHSFSKSKEWIGDFEYFVALSGGKIQESGAASIQLASGMHLGLGWVQGDERFLDA